MPKRDERGRFEKGESGNSRGRPRKAPARHREPISNRAAVFEVAEEVVKFRTDKNAELEETTVYKAVLRALAVKGVNGNVAAAKEFLKRADGASSIYGDTHAMIEMLIKEQARLELLVEKYEAKYKKTHGVLVVPWEEFNERAAQMSKNWAERSKRGIPVGEVARLHELRGG